MANTLTANAGDLISPFTVGVQNVAFSKYVFNGQTLSADTVVQMVKIPSDAIVTRVQIGWTLDLTEGSIGVGVGSATAAFFAALSIGATGYFDSIDGTSGVGAGYGLTISRSDAVHFLGDTIDISFGGAVTSTATGTLQLAVWFQTPPYS